jgi:hypothetical protein
MMGKRLGRIRLESVVVREERKLVIIPAPPKTFHKNAYTPKTNPLRNKLDTTLDPPIFPHPTNDFQKPIKFKSNLGMRSLGKRVRSLERRNQKISRVRNLNHNQN